MPACASATSQHIRFFFDIVVKLTTLSLALNVCRQQKQLP
jgi:hypothetical protein